MSHCPKTALAAVVGLDDIPSGSGGIPPCTASPHMLPNIRGRPSPLGDCLVQGFPRQNLCPDTMESLPNLHTWTKLCTVLFTWRTFRRGIHPGPLQHLTVPCTGNSSDAPRRSSATMHEPKTQMQLPRAQEPTNLWHDGFKSLLRDHTSNNKSSVS